MKNVSIYTKIIKIFKFRPADSFFCCKKHNMRPARSFKFDVPGLGYGGHKSEVMCHEWHLFKISLMAAGFVKTIYYFRGPPSIKS